MFCRYCGTKLPDEAIFCARCGKRLVGEETPASPTNAAVMERMKAVFAGARARGKAIFAAVKARLKNGEPTSGKRAFPEVEHIKHFLRLHKKPVLGAGCTVVLLAAVLLGTSSMRSKPAPVSYQSRSDSGGAVGSSTSSSSASDRPAQVSTSASSGSPEAPSSTPAADSSTIRTEPEVPAADGAVLPDPGIFLGGLSRVEDKSAYDGWIVSYSFDIDGKEAVQEYLKLLKSSNYHLKQQPLNSTWNFSYEGTDYTQYAFDYTGSEDVGSITELDATGAAVLLINYYNGQGRIGLSLAYSSDFTLVDPGERASDPPEDFNGSGNGSSSTSSSGSKGSVKDCAICKGTGDCTTCGGDGYLYSSASEKEDRNCWKCRGHDGKCTACNGTGKQQI